RFADLARHLTSVARVAVEPVEPALQALGELERAQAKACEVAAALGRRVERRQREAADEIPHGFAQRRMAAELARVEPPRAARREPEYAHPLLDRRHG